MPVQAIHTALMTSVDSQGMSSLRPPQAQRAVKTATDKLESKRIPPNAPDRVLVTSKHSQPGSRLSVPESE